MLEPRVPRTCEIQKMRCRQQILMKALGSPLKKGVARSKSTDAKKKILKTGASAGHRILCKQ